MPMAAIALWFPCFVFGIIEERLLLIGLSLSVPFELIVGASTTSLADPLMSNERSFWKIGLLLCWSDPYQTVVDLGMQPPLEIWFGLDVIWWNHWPNRLGRLPAKSASFIVYWSYSFSLLMCDIRSLGLPVSSIATNVVILFRLSYLSRCEDIGVNESKNLGQVLVGILGRLGEFMPS
jgi:hypothetical protein